MNNDKDSLQIDSTFQHSDDMTTSKHNILMTKLDEMHQEMRDYLDNIEKNQIAIMKGLVMTIDDMKIKIGENNEQTITQKSS
jgi:hypothetical protein